MSSIFLEAIEEELGELTKKQCEFVRTVELLNSLKFIDKFKWIGIGRKPSDRLSLFCALFYTYFLIVSIKYCFYAIRVLLY